MTDLSDDDLRRMAKERVGFRSNATSYVIVNAFLVGIWFFTSDSRDVTDGSFWPIWPILGWGVGLAFHAWGVYGGGRSWEEREYEKLKAKHGRP